MQLPTVFLALVMVSSLAQSISKASKGNTSSRSSLVIEATVKTLKCCYGNRGYAVGLAGDVDGILIGAFFRQSIPAALFDDTSETSESVSIGRQLRYRLPLFAVVASSSTELKDILSKFRDTIWWNHMASFFILNHPPESDHECSKAREMLWSAWEFNLLNAKFVCLDRDEGHLIYGYNPYTSMAPDPWESRETHVGRNDHAWTLLALRFQDDKQVCEVLDFDKTKDLAGHQVPVSVVPFFSNVITFDSNKTEMAGWNGSIGNIAKIICEALNGTCKAMILPESTIAFYADNIALGRLIDETSDIAFVPKFMTTSANHTRTYPYWLTGIGVLTQFSGYASQLSKIKSVIDSTSRHCVCLVLIITLGFFKFCLGESLTSAILNNVRIICNGSIPNVPSNHSARIYLAGLFLFALTVLALYQGQLASLLTKPVSLPNIETMNDLGKSRHWIYAYKAFGRYFNDPVFEGRVIRLDEPSCVHYALKNSSAACVGERQFLIKLATANNLHLSKTICKDYWIFPIRTDWPLERRVNDILARLANADIVRYWFLKDIRATIDRFDYFKKVKGEQKFEVMTLNELAFAFAILGIGLGLATAVFIVEVGVDWARCKIGSLGYKNQRNHIFINKYK